MVLLLVLVDSGWSDLGLVRSGDGRCEAQRSVLDRSGGRVGRVFLVFYVDLGWDLQMRWES